MYHLLIPSENVAMSFSSIAAALNELKRLIGDQPLRSIPFRIKPSNRP
jgi:hypothetical protein